MDALKITEKKLSKKMLWNKEKKRGLEFKPGLVVITLQTTGPLGFMNLLGSNLPVSHPLYKILCSLKFETGSYFLKFIKKCCTLGKIRQVNIHNPLWRH